MCRCTLDNIYLTHCSWFVLFASSYYFLASVSLRDSKRLIILKSLLLSFLAIPIFAEAQTPKVRGQTHLPQKMAADLTYRTKNSNQRASTPMSRPKRLTLVQKPTRATLFVPVLEATFYLKTLQRARS